MLSPEQAELVQLIQEMPAEGVQRVLEFARTVRTQSPIDYTDQWTEEELRAVAHETLRRLDEIDPYPWPDQEEKK